MVKFHVFPHGYLASLFPVTVPKSKARRDYLASHRQHADIVFVGDSIFEAIEWAEEFPYCRAANRGIAGESSADILDRIDDIAALNASTYVIMAGVNDLGRGRPVEAVQRDIQKIVHSLPGRKIVLEVTPCAPDYKQGDPGKIERLNKRLAGIEGARFIRPGLTPDDLADALHPNATGIAKLVGAIRAELCGATAPG